MDRRNFLAIASFSSIIGMLPGCNLGEKKLITPQNSKAKFLEYLESRGINPTDALAEEILSSTLEFYSHEVAGLSKEPSSDMLLYEWGVYEIDGSELFVFDLTRQFIEAGKEGDNAFSMLGFNCYYSLTPNLRQIERGYKWCELRKQKAEFKDYILASPAYNEVKGNRAVKSVLFWERA